MAAAARRLAAVPLLCLPALTGAAGKPSSPTSALCRRAITTSCNSTVTPVHARAPWRSSSLTKCRVTSRSALTPVRALLPSPLVRHASTTSQGDAASGDDEPVWFSVLQLLQYLGLAYCVDEYVFHLTNTQGPSMLPTLNELGDIVLIDRITPRITPYAANDIVVAASMSKRGTSVCKRVIATAGDDVQPFGWCHAVTVPPRHVWLEGDNPLDSADSRYYGPVPVDMLQGRVVARIWPLNQWAWLAGRQARPTHNSLYYAAMAADETLCGRAEAVRREMEQARAARAAAVVVAESATAGVMLAAPTLAVTEGAPVLQQHAGREPGTPSP